MQLWARLQMYLHPSTQLQTAFLKEGHADTDTNVQVEVIKWIKSISFFCHGDTVTHTGIMHFSYYEIQVWAEKKENTRRILWWSFWGGCVKLWRGTVCTTSCSVKVTFLSVVTGHSSVASPENHNLNRLSKPGPLNIIIFFTFEGQSRGWHGESMNAVMTLRYKGFQVLLRQSGFS